MKTAHLSVDTLVGAAEALEPIVPSVAFESSFAGFLSKEVALINALGKVMVKSAGEGFLVNHTPVGAAFINVLGPAFLAIGNSLLSLEEIDKQIEEMDQDIAAIKNSEFSFLINMLLYPDFQGINKIPKNKSKAYWTGKLLHLTKQNEFSILLESNIKIEPSVKRRRKIIMDAYGAHCDAKYTLSILPLLAQIEGIYLDALTKQKVIECISLKGKMVYKIGKKKVKGLFDIAHLDPAKGEDYEDTIKPIKQYISVLNNVRNPILHGNSVRYASPYLSTKLLLTLFVLVEAIAYDHKMNK